MYSPQIIQAYSKIISTNFPCQYIIISLHSHLVFVLIAHIQLLLISFDWPP